MIRLRWQILIMTGCLFFTGFVLWLNQGRMPEDSPFNDSLLVFFMILWVFIGLPYYITPFLMKLKSSNIDGPGLSDTLDNSEPLFVVDRVLAVDKEGNLKEEDGKAIVIYDRYNVYNLGSASAFGLKMKGGAWNGIGVFPSHLCHRVGSSVQIMVTDIEAFRTPDDKKKLPAHVLRRIKHEYKVRGWWWNDEYPLFWGEVPLLVDMDAATVVASYKERCEALEENRKTWEDIARQYEIELMKKDDGPPVKPKLIEFGKREEEER